MRRVTLLALLALALPMAALANAIDPVNASAGFTLQVGPNLTVGNFSGPSSACLSHPDVACSTGNYFNRISINGGTVWRLNLVSPTGTIRLDFMSLTNFNGTGAACDLHNTNSMGACDFTGEVTALAPTIPGQMFTDSVSGTLHRGPNVMLGSSNNPWVLTTLTGELGNDAGDLSVENVQFCRNETAQGCGMNGQSGRLRSGFGVATLTVGVESAIPEPGTLALLGTGVIGLAAMVRRRCKLGM